MKVSRRAVLQGIGGVALGLPLLEGLTPGRARAEGRTEPYAIFFREANGVAAAQNTGEIGQEPERFWPREQGLLTPENVSGRAVGELVDYRTRLLAIAVNMHGYNYGDGHARGALQGLTARGPTVQGAGGNSEAAGESIDHRIGRELNPNGRDSLFLYAGRGGGWLGGACISYRGSGQRRAALHSPWDAYQSFVSGDSSEASHQLVQRRKSVNDLVRDQMKRLLGREELSSGDRQRLQLHFDSVRDLEVALSCRLAADAERTIENAGEIHTSTNGDEVIETTKLHMDLAVLAVACGYTRSVAIQFGNGNDGSTRFRDPDTGNLMENFHYISHRRMSHDANGSVIPGSDLLHHKIDVQFARTFKHLLDRLDEYEMPDGQRLLDAGVSVWYNDLANGPAHGPNGCPFILAGSAGGFLQQGQYLRFGDGSHSRLLNTIGSAAGLRKSSGDLIDDFGDSGRPRNPLTEIMT